MESPSEPAHRGCVPWQGLMMTASLLTFWSLPTTAKLNIELVPPHVLEGKDVLFRVHNLPGNGAAYTWCKGESSNKRFQIVFYQIITKQIIFGPLSKKKETIYPNGSLLLRDVTVLDAGYYNLLFTQKSFDSHAAYINLQVYSLLPKPSLTSNRTNPVENKEPVLLKCEPDTQDTTYLWFFNTHSLRASARLQLSKDNRNLTLITVTRNDTGSYECEIRNPASASRSDPLTLNVLYGPDPPTISPSDSYYLRGTNLSLSCHAASNPPAQYSWRINGITQKTKGELFIPNLTLNNSGSYTCLAHNSITDLKRTTINTIRVYEPVGKPVIRAGNATVRENKDSVILTCLSNDTEISTHWLFKNQQLLLTDRMKLSRDNSTLTIKPVRRENAGEYQCEVFNPASSRKSDPFKLDVQYSTPIPRLSDGSIAGIVIGLLAGVALIAVLMCFMCTRKTTGASDQ